MPPTNSDPPNVLLICADQWRGDCLSALGHPVVATPYLDRLIGASTAFTRAYSATPTCVPARAALMTGQSQERHGRVGYADGVAWNYPTTLAGEFAKAGYQRQAVGKMHTYPQRSRLGFTDVALHDGYLHFSRREHPEQTDVDDYLAWLRTQLWQDADYTEHGLQCNSVVARPWDKPEYTHPTNWVVTRCARFLRERDTSRPFLLYASFHRPHPPYDPPGWAFDQYLHEPMPPPPVGDWTRLWDDWADSTDPAAAVADYGERTLRRARAGYYGHMSHIDAQLNRLFEIMDALDVADNTVVCFVSDHGELMGDHHLFRKSLPYEGSARIPFVLHAPDHVGVRHGGLRDEVVELRDVLPTLLDCAGLPVPETVEGRSVLPLARGDDGEQWREYLHGEHVYFGQSIQWLTDGRTKYVWCGGTGAEQLFDLVADPNECHDIALAGEEPERVAAWRARMVTALAWRPEGFVRDGDLVPGRPVSEVIPGRLDTTV